MSYQDLEKNLSHLQETIGWEIEEIQSKLDAVKARIDSKDQLGAGLTTGMPIETSKLNQLLGKYDLLIKLMK